MTDPAITELTDLTTVLGLAVEDPPARASETQVDGLIVRVSEFTITSTRPPWAEVIVRTDAGGHRSLTFLPGEWGKHSARIICGARIHADGWADPRVPRGDGPAVVVRGRVDVTPGWLPADLEPAEAAELLRTLERWELAAWNKTYATPPADRLTRAASYEDMSAQADDLDDLLSDVLQLTVTRGWRAHSDSIDDFSASVLGEVAAAAAAVPVADKPLAQVAYEAHLAGCGMPPERAPWEGCGPQAHVCWQNVVGEVLSAAATRRCRYVADQVATVEECADGGCLFCLADLAARAARP